MEQQTSARRVNRTDVFACIKRTIAILTYELLCRVAVVNFQTICALFTLHSARELDPESLRSSQNHVAVTEIAENVVWAAIVIDLERADTSGDVHHPRRGVGVLLRHVDIQPIFGSDCSGVVGSDDDRSSGHGEGHHIVTVPATIHEDGGVIRHEVHGPITSEAFIRREGQRDSGAYRSIACGRVDGDSAVFGGGHRDGEFLSDVIDSRNKIQAIVGMVMGVVANEMEQHLVSSRGQDSKVVIVAVRAAQGIVCRVAVKDLQVVIDHDIVHGDGSELDHLVFRGDEQEVAVAAEAVVVVWSAVVIDLEAFHTFGDSGHQGVGWTATVSWHVDGKLDGRDDGRDEIRANGDFAAGHDESAGVVGVPSASHCYGIAQGVGHAEVIEHISLSGCGRQGDEVVYRC